MKKAIDFRRPPEVIAFESRSPLQDSLKFHRREP
jgi:hypothetical protein